MRSVFFISIYFIFLLLNVSFSFSNEPIHLCNQPNSYVSNYDKLALQIQQNAMKNPNQPQIVCFSQGLCFEIVGFLGNGNTTLIFELKDGRAIRIPKYTTHNAKLEKSKKFLKDYYETASLLLNENLPMTHVYLEDSRPDEFVITEKLNLIKNKKGRTLTFAEFIKPLFKENFQMSLEQESYLTEEFMEFSKKFYLFTFIGDFNPSQIAYSPEKGWVLLDWTEGIKKVSTKFYHATVFDAHFEKLSRALKHKIKKSIMNQREVECILDQFKFQKKNHPN